MGGLWNTFFAIVTMFFDRFASNLVDTWAWYRRIVSCEKTSWRNDVVTLWRKNVHFSGFWKLCDCVFRRICFKFDGDMDMVYMQCAMWDFTSWRNDVVMLWRKNVCFVGFLATMAVFFDGFASNLVRHGRITPCEKGRHDVTTSRRYKVY